MPSVEAAEWRLIMFKKKVLLLISCAVLGIGLLAGCASKDSTSTPSNQEKTAQEESSQEESVKEEVNDDSAVIEIEDGEGTGGM